MRPEVEELLAKGRRSLEVARSLTRQGHFDFAVSRAYYAMFYLAEALLLSRGFQAGSHSGVIALLHREFVRVGLLDGRHVRDLEAAREERHLGDYGWGRPISESRAGKAVERAREFVEVAEASLRRTG